MKKIISTCKVSILGILLMSIVYDIPYSKDSNNKIHVKPIKDCWEDTNGTTHCKDDTNYCLNQFLSTLEKKNCLERQNIHKLP